MSHDSKTDLPTLDENSNFDELRAQHGDATLPCSVGWCIGHYPEPGMTWAKLQHLGREESLTGENAEIKSASALVRKGKKYQLEVWFEYEGDVDDRGADVLAAELLRAAGELRTRAARLRELEAS